MVQHRDAGGEHPAVPPIQLLRHDGEGEQRAHLVRRPRLVRRQREQRVATRAQHQLDLADAESRLIAALCRGQAEDAGVEVALAVQVVAGQFHARDGPEVQPVAQAAALPPARAQRASAELLPAFPGALCASAGGALSGVVTLEDLASVGGVV